LFRGTYHIIAFFSKGGAVKEKVVLGLDLLTVLANFGLSIAIAVAEHKASDTWKDYDEDATNTGIISAGLNAVAGISYVTAFLLKEANPPISAVGAAIMIGTMGGAAVLQGAVFKMQYDELRSPRLASGPSF